MCRCCCTIVVILGQAGISTPDVKDKTQALYKPRFLSSDCTCLVCRMFGGWRCSSCRGHDSSLLESPWVNCRDMISGIDACARAAGVFVGRSTRLRRETWWQADFAGRCSRVAAKKKYHHGHLRRGCWCPFVCAIVFAAVAQAHSVACGKGLIQRLQTRRKWDGNPVGVGLFSLVSSCFALMARERPLFSCTYDVDLVGSYGFVVCFLCLAK